MRYKVSDIADIINVSIKSPSNCGINIFVGLEHYDVGEPVITRYGSTDMLTTAVKKFNSGDILLARRNVYLRRAGKVDFDGVTSGDSIVIRVKSDLSKMEDCDSIVMKSLLPFILNTNIFWDYANTNSDGTMSKRLSPQMLLDYEFDLPPLEEQKVLADKLWAAYRLKESYKKLLAATEEMVKSQFIEMFDFENNSHNWSVMSFNDFASLDCTMTTDYDYYADYPHIGIDSIEQNTGRLYGYRTVKEDNVKSGKYIFTPNHIIYSKIRPNLNKVAVPDFDGLCSADSYPILPNNEVTSKDFLVYLLRSDVFLRYIIPLSNRTGMPKVNREQVEGFACPLPPKSEQSKFVTIYHQADKSESLYQIKIAS
jgi:type I restriction enzyme S subunit